LSYYSGLIKDLQDDVERLKAQNARLRAAVEFYANAVYDGDNEGGGYAFGVLNGDKKWDEGDIAREALKG